MGSIFDDEDVRDSFQRTDFKLTRTAQFSNQTLCDTLMRRAIPRFDREGTERYVYGVLEDSGRCGLLSTSWQKFIAHQMHNKETITASNHQCELQFSRINVSIAARAETRRQLMDHMHL